MSVPSVRKNLSLLKTITAYRKGCVRFEREAPMDADDALFDKLAEASFAPHQRSLNAWSSPAANREEAVAALILAANEADRYGTSDMVVPMIYAAVAYMLGTDR